MADTKPAPSADVDSLAWIGHGLPAVAGVASLAAAVGALRSDIQITLVISLIILGVLLPALAWLSWGRNRAAWAFLISLSVVLGIMTLFGAPKVRNLVGIPLGVALVIPAAFAVATFCLSALGHRYKT